MQGGAAVVAFAAEHDLTGVDGHPHPQRGSLRPRFGLQRLLGVEGGGDGVRRSLEGGQHRIALALLDRAHPTMGGDGLIEQGVEASDRRRHHLGSALPGRGGRLDIGEQERHRAGGQRASPGRHRRQSRARRAGHARASSTSTPGTSRRRLMWR